MNKILLSFILLTILSPTKQAIVQANISLRRIKQIERMKGVRYPVLKKRLKKIIKLLDKDSRM